MSDRFAETLDGRWQLDRRRSRVEFRAGHFWGLAAVSGHFTDYEGRLDLGAEPAVALTIDAASLTTGHAKRDRHLRSADFFDAERHPQLRFVSEAVSVHGDVLHVRGRLSVRERSVALELDARIELTGDELEIDAVTGASHRELGMTWNALGMIPPRSQLHVHGYLVPVARAGTSVGLRDLGEAAGPVGIDAPVQGQAPGEPLQGQDLQDREQVLGKAIGGDRQAVGPADA